ncbi:uncharacterized protein ARMOST_18694 [Armillaria ostoyae]|uniref:Uncharacterized protein n=1 Tax=Armillaria ostoyae TaxID=47428 RepID=A0A284S2G5_ARMOS|nr:uncharacterized protein ARMOST_18694 [Armillaria ostoyae]
MVKVACYCNSHQCGGSEKDARTARRHQEEDWAHNLLHVQAEEIHLQDDRIAEYIDNMMMGGESLNSTINLAGRMWSKEPVGTEIPHFRSSCYSTDADTSDSAAGESRASKPHFHDVPRRKRIAVAMDVLKNIAFTLDDLTFSLSAELIRLRSIKETSPDFPLTPFHDQTNELHARLERVISKEACVKMLKNDLEKTLADIDDQISRYRKTWQVSVLRLQEAKASASGVHYNTDQHFRPILSLMDSVTLLSVFMVISCHVILCVSRRGCAWILGMLCYIIQTVFLDFTSVSQMSPAHQNILADFPRDVRTPTAKFDLDSRSTVYAICPDPKCHRAHKPTFNISSPIPHYPKSCTRGCKQELCRIRKRNGYEIQVPLKPFIYFHMQEWLAELLSRKGLEEKMDDTWKTPVSQTSDMRDIFDGSILQEF